MSPKRSTTTLSSDTIDLTTTAPQQAATRTATRRRSTAATAAEPALQPERGDRSATTPFLTARNPYALVEGVLGRPVDWSEVTDRPAMLEDVLQTPYEQLFDPKYGSPIYLGSALDRAGRVMPSAPKVRRNHSTKRDDEGPASVETAPARLADLQPLVGGSLADVPVRSVTPSRAGGWTVEIGPSEQMRKAALDRIFDADVIGRLWNDKIFELGWTPPGGQWADTGSFFSEAAEFFDPVQGQLGDCWLIAAMSSCAWALPYTFAQRSRATGTDNEQFTNQFTFIDPANGQGHTFEATDATVVYSGTTSPMYGKSSESGEIWPALVEKAYAMWRGGGQWFDKPNLTVLNGGDPVHASAALTGRKPHYTWTSGQTAAQLTTLVKSHCVSYRTVDPMTAWTYGTAPAGVSYSDANIVANHAYSVLGWTSGVVIRRALTTMMRQLDGQRIIERSPLLQDMLQLPTWFLRDYIVLRNPWGYHEGTQGALHTTISMRDVSFWRSIDLDASDGVFAIDFSTFQKCFAGIGVAT
jgi:hypothetical protein